MDIAELKEKARTLEEQGDAAGALAVYREILDEIEGTRAILGELPLYVKAGDLLLKQRHAKDAVAMYDRAARLYAQHGSSKSVLALCGRILTVSPGATSVYPRYAGLMVRTGHVPDAVALLKHYAETQDLPAVAEDLEPFADRQDEDAKRAVEMVIEIIGRNEDLKREMVQAQQRHSAEAARPARSSSADPMPAAAPPPASEPPPPPAASERPDPSPPGPEDPGHEEPGSDAGPEDLSFLQAGTEDLRAEPEEEAEPDTETGAEPEPVVVHGADPLLVEKPEATVVHGFEPVPPGEEASVAPEEREPSESVAPVAGDPANKEYAPSAAPRMERQAGPAKKGRSGSKLARVVLVLIAVVGGGAGLVYFEVIPPDVLGFLRGLAGDTAPRPPVVVVDGLRIVSVDPYSSGAVTGSRVVQLLDTGERLTLTVLPADGPAAGSGVSEVRVTSVRPDSATGTARLGRFVVTAGGRVGAGVLEVLLRRLVEQD